MCDVVLSAWLFAKCYSAKDGDTKLKQHFCHHGDTICHPITSLVTTKLNRMSAMQQRCRQADESYFLVFLPSAYAENVGLASETHAKVAIRRPWLNSLFVVFKMSFLPKYDAKHYDYIVKLCSGVACNSRASLDIALILALTHDNGIDVVNASVITSACCR